MKQFRTAFRVVVTLAMTVILCIAGYNITLKYLYPKDFSEYVEKYSDEFDVSPELIYAVIKCESNFDPKAQSDAGAKGLMQLTEATFSDVGKMLGDETKVDFKSDASTPEISIKYGTRYLKYLDELFEGDTTAVIAAYNAGLGNVREWMGDEKLEISEIEFAETKEYVKKVQKAEKYYIELYN